MTGLCPHISIVTTVYKSQPFLEEFIQLCLKALAAIQCTDFEIIFVNDGSPDNSLECLIRKKAQISQIIILDLSRNFGHHYAAMAGLNYARGDYVFMIDCDLEISPLILNNFYEVLTENNYDVVYGYQERRKGDFWEKYSGQLFWRAFNILSETKLPLCIVTERLMTRPYVKSLLTLGDRNLFLGGMMHWAGFNQVGIPVTKGQRKGISTYSFAKRVQLMVEAISSFSSFPLRLLFNIGFLITLFTFIWGTSLIILKLISPERFLLGYVSVVVIILFSLGLILMSLGILGVYLSKIFNQVQSRPLYIIKHIFK